MKVRSRLGRGLDSLIPNVLNEPEDINKNNIIHIIKLNKIAPNPEQPRKHFKTKKLESLSESIKNKGVLQPIIITPTDKNGMHMIIAGERRWRASKLAKKEDIIAVIKHPPEDEILELSILENINRDSLSSIEEAFAYKALTTKYHYTQSMIAQKFNKSRSYIANMTRLLKLPKEILDMLNNNLISAGHARALINCKDPIPLAHSIITKKLSVRQIEQIINNKSPTKSSEATTEQNIGNVTDQNELNPQNSASKEQTHTEQASTPKDKDTLEIEANITKQLGATSTLNYNANDVTNGKLEITFDNLDHLFNIISKIDSISDENL